LFEAPASPSKELPSSGLERVNDGHSPILADHSAHLDQESVLFRADDHREPVVLLPDSHRKAERMKDVAVADAMLSG
jgi:hypothetical protein